VKHRINHNSLRAIGESRNGYIGSVTDSDFVVTGYPLEARRTAVHQPSTVQFFRCPWKPVKR